MIALNAVVDGARAVNRARRIVAIYWAATLFFALLGVAPAGALLAHSLGHSLYAGRLFVAFDPQWFAEFFLSLGSAALNAVPPLMLLIGGGYLLLSTLLAGGALAVLAAGDDDFYEGCGRNFWRLFRLLLISLVAYALVFVLGGALDKVAQSVWGGGMEERPIAIFTWCRAALVILLLLFVNMVIDYARIRLVVEDSRKALRAALGAFRLVLHNFAPAAGACALIWALAIALLLAWLAVSAVLPRRSAAWLLVVLAAQQAYVLARIWVRLLFFAGEARVYLKVTPPRMTQDRDAELTAGAAPTDLAGGNQ